LMTALGLLVSVGGAVLTLRDYRSQNGGFMTLGQGFKTGMVMFAVSSVLSAIYNWAAFKYIHPNLGEEMVNATMAQLEATPGANEEMLEMMEGMYNFIFSTSFQLIGGILGGLITGAVVAVIVAAIMKKDPPLEA
ncbi:MAG: DUF4199 domain-containing protein, partial [Bacteroidota bacterium]